MIFPMPGKIFSVDALFMRGRMVFSCYNGDVRSYILKEADEIAAAAYRLTTDGAFSTPQPWQAALYQRLANPEEDLGGLLLAPTGAGKVEAVVIPALGLRRGGAPRRLFLIGADRSPLDDYLYRLVPYLKAFVQADETPRALCLDTADTQANLCRRFFADGTDDPHLVTNPLEADVDLILTTFSRFRELFFGSGGIHALPAALPDTQSAFLRRDLFFFDEAHQYDGDSFSRFHRLVEFLYAEDLDVVVGSSTLPPAYAEELSFLETLPGPNSALLPPCTLRFQPEAEPLQAIEAEIRRAYFQNSRVFGVAETVEDAQALHRRLLGAYPHSVYLYHEALSADARRRVYAQVRELEKEGEGYLLLTTGNALEASDLDATLLLSTVCAPANLIRRAGRVNRRGDLPHAEIVLVGEGSSQAAAYLAALRAESGKSFDPELWKAYIS